MDWIGLPAMRRYLGEDQRAIAERRAMRNWDARRRGVRGWPVRGSAEGGQLETDGADVQTDIDAHVRFIIIRKQRIDYSVSCLNSLFCGLEAQNSKPNGELKQRKAQWPQMNADERR